MDPCACAPDGAGPDGSGLKPWGSSPTTSWTWPTIVQTTSKHSPLLQSSASQPVEVSAGWGGVGHWLLHCGMKHFSKYKCV